MGASFFMQYGVKWGFCEGNDHFLLIFISFSVDSNIGILLPL